VVVKLKCTIRNEKVDLSVRQNYNRAYTNRSFITGHALPIDGGVNAW